MPGPVRDLQLAAPSPIEALQASSRSLRPGLGAIRKKQNSYFCPVSSELAPRSAPGWRGGIPRRRQVGVAFHAVALAEAAGVVDCPDHWGRQFLWQLRLPIQLGGQFLWQLRLLIQLGGQLFMALCHCRLLAPDTFESWPIERPRSSSASARSGSSSSSSPAMALGKIASRLPKTW